MSQTIHGLTPGQDRSTASQEQDQQVPDEQPAHIVLDLRWTRTTGPTVPDSSYYLG